MELKDVQTFLTENKDNDDVKTFVAGLNPLSVDRVKEFVGKDTDAKSWFDSEKDKHLQKGIETFKANNLQKLIDDAVAKANPQETPEQKQIRELTERLNKKDAESVRQDLTNKALKVAGEKKLPAELVNFFVGKDEDETAKNLGILEKSFNAGVNAVAEERLKSGYKPPKSDPNPATATEQAKTQINAIFGLK